MSGFLVALDESTGVDVGGWDLPLLLRLGGGLEPCAVGARRDLDGDVGDQVYVAVAPRDAEGDLAD